MNIKPFIPKEIQELPDFYGIKVFYINGKSEEFELASHRFTKDTGLIEFWTKDDICNWLPIANIQRIEFDKNFSKIISLKVKKEGN